MLAVARDQGLTASELESAADLDESIVDDARRVLSQYLSPPNDEGRLRLYHQSFREFLLKDSEHRVYPEEANEALACFFVLARRRCVAEDPSAVRRRRLPLGACEPVLKSGVGAFAGTPVCCLEHELQLRLITRGSGGRRSCGDPDDGPR
jgi:hypothetical protein